MVAPLPHIQNELAKLQANADKLHQEFAQAYRSYLSTLSKSVQPQLVQVCFMLCTERHASEFLKLSLTQRQSLQQDIQKIGFQLGQNLIELGNNHFSVVSITESDAETSAEFSAEPAVQQTPEELLTDVQKLETAISDALVAASLEVNRTLEKYKILQIKSLEALFEIAAKANKAGRSITNPPLLVKAIIDTKVETKDEEKKSSPQPLTAIYLHLADLEFADAALLGDRQPLRQLNQSLDRLQKRYSQKLEEQVMAEASAAWRASWYSYTPPEA
ncbi:MAG: hypothetical protein AAGB01_03410 [Cyanobacteria bacterium P01_F01_bin.42]